MCMPVCTKTWYSTQHHQIAQRIKFKKMQQVDLPIPSTLADITPAWVSKVTGHEVLEDDFHTEGDIQAGIGFLSSICRIGYKTETGEKNQVIVKLLPTTSKWLEFALADLSDEREIQFYSIVLPDLIKVIPEIQENICVFYNGAVKPADPSVGTNRASMLIIEDLKPLGYEMMEFAGNCSDLVLQDLIKFMARLHFGGFALEIEKGKSLPELYPFMQGIEPSSVWQSQMESLSSEGFPQLETLLLSHNMPEVLEHYNKLKPYTDVIIKKIDEYGRKCPALVHTDVWPPNIFHHASLPVKVLDWQLLGYRDVAYDLTIMLHTVLGKEDLTKEKMRAAIRAYYDEFEHLCESQGYGEKIKRRTWEEFEEFFFTWGNAFGYMIYLPSIECYAKNYAKYANLFRVLQEEIHLPEFLLRVGLESE